MISVATAGSAASAAGVTDILQGKAIADENFNLSGKSIKITLDGVTREIALGDYSASPDTIGSELQTLVNNAFGKNASDQNKINVSYDTSTNKLTFNTAGGASKLTLSAGTNDGLAALGFSSGMSNRLDINKSLEDLSATFANDLTFNSEGKLVFTINSKKFTFDKSTSLSSMMSTISNDTDAKVNMKYDETTDKIVLTAKQFGYGENIAIGTSQEGNFFGAGGASGIGTGNATTSQGVDASAMIDGQLVTRSSNTFTLNGATYTLLKAQANPATESETVTLSTNTDDVYNNIKGFVDKYNEIIAGINSKMSEKYDSDYPPLTDDQKEAMSDDEIKTWESKAKTGLLHNDSMLQSLAYSMRQALSDAVEGSSINLSAIGITTGSYSENGKLIIDDAKLKAAIEKDPNAVSDLFSKQAATSYNASNTPALRSQRYKTEGLANRLSDILDDNIRTTNGKGALLQKAGIEGDSTQYTSTLFLQIDGYDDDISALITKLNDKQDAYYAKFTAMEKYISQMNAQSSWLASQLGGSS